MFLSTTDIIPYSSSLSLSHGASLSHSLTFPHTVFSTPSLTQPKRYSSSPPRAIDPPPTDATPPPPAMPYLYQPSTYTPDTPAHHKPTQYPQYPTISNNNPHLPHHTPSPPPLPRLPSLPPSLNVPSLLLLGYSEAQGASTQKGCHYCQYSDRVSTVHKLSTLNQSTRLPTRKTVSRSSISGRGARRGPPGSDGLRTDCGHE